LWYSEVEDKGEELKIKKKPSANKEDCTWSDESNGTTGKQSAIKHDKNYRDSKEHPDQTGLKDSTWSTHREETAHKAVRFY